VFAFKCVQSSQYFNNNFYIYRVIVSSLFVCESQLPGAYQSVRDFTPFEFGSPEVQPTKKQRGILECSLFSVVSSSVIIPTLFMNMNDVQLKVLLLFLGFFFVKKIKSIRLDRNLSLLFAASCNKHTYTSMK